MNKKIASLSRIDVSMATTAYSASRAWSMATIVVAFFVVIIFTALWIGQLVS